MGPIWDPSGHPAYGLTYMGPMPNPVALPIWVAHMGPIYACLLGPVAHMGIGVDKLINVCILIILIFALLKLRI